MAHTERERKFLISRPPPRLSVYPRQRIRQGYLVIAEDGSEVRLREITSHKLRRHLLTIKHPHARQARTEMEISLTPKQFSQLWPLTQFQRVEKTRYRIPHPPRLTIELDLYRGSLRGLAVAEIEFPSSRQAREFHPPSWFGADLSDDSRFSNQSLARHGRPKRLKYS